MRTASTEGGTAHASRARFRDRPVEHAVIAAIATMFLLIALVSGVTHAINPPRPILKFLDVGSERSLWTWTNVVVLAFAATAHICAAWLRKLRDLPHVGFWLLTSALVAALSIDDLAQLHEQLEPLGRSLDSGNLLPHFPWLIPGAAIAAAIIALFLVAIRKAEPVPRRLLVLATLSFFGGAIGLELANAYVLEAVGGIHAAYIVTMHVEELLEALGATTGLLSTIEVRTGASATKIGP